MVLPDSYGISRAPYYSGGTQHSPRCFGYRGLTVYARPFHTLHLHRDFLTVHQTGRPGTRTPTTPPLQPLPGITQRRFSLIRFRSPLLTESRLLSLPVGTEMFHFPTFPPHTLYIQVRVTSDETGRVSPFGHPRITVWLSTPRGLSQIPTSFFGS